MLQDNGLFWLIAFVFFLPLHLAVPMAVLFFNGRVEEPQRWLRLVLLEGAIGAVLGVSLTAVLWSKFGVSGLLVLPLVMLLSWGGLWWRIKKAGPYQR